MKRRKESRKGKNNNFDPSSLREPPSAILDFPMVTKGQYNSNGIMNYYGMKCLNSSNIVDKRSDPLFSYTYILNKRRATINGFKLFLNQKNFPLYYTIVGSRDGVSWHVIEENIIHSESNFIFVSCQTSYQFFRICSTSMLHIKEFEIYGKVDSL